MAKTITVKDNTYHRLAALKGGKESFSDLLDRLACRPGLEVIEKLRGSLDIPDKQAFLSEIAAKRKERRFA